MRLPLVGSGGRGPSASVNLYQVLPLGLPINFPGSRCFKAHAPFHGPWLSVKNISPSELVATPPGERSPLHVGMTLPSAEIRKHQPRYRFSLVNEPVRQSVTQM